MHFVEALASMLEHRARLAIKEPYESVFHSETVPQMSIRDYLMRIVKYFRCSDECFVLSFVYIERIGKLHPEFSISQFSAHRLQLTSIIIASKFFDEGCYLNSYYANVGGVTTREVNGLEARFLELIGWQLHVSPDEYDSCRKRVMCRMLPCAIAVCPTPDARTQRRCNKARRGAGRRCERRRDSRQRHSA